MLLGSKHLVDFLLFPLLSLVLQACFFLGDTVLRGYHTTQPGQEVWCYARTLHQQKFFLDMSICQATQKNHTTLHLLLQAGLALENNKYEHVEEKVFRPPTDNREINQQMLFPLTSTC